MQQLREHVRAGEIVDLPLKRIEDPAQGGNN